MIRVALAAALAVGLLAVALPAVEDARDVRVTNGLRSSAEGVATTLDRFARRNDAVPPGGPVASRVLTVTVPERPGPGREPTLYVGGLPDREMAGDGPRSDVVAVAVGGESRVVARLSTDVRRRADGGARRGTATRPPSSGGSSRSPGAPAMLASDDEPLALSGEERLRVRLVLRGDVPTLVVERWTGPAPERTRG